MRGSTVTADPAVDFTPDEFDPSRVDPEIWRYTQLLEHLISVYSQQAEETARLQLEYEAKYDQAITTSEQTSADRREADARQYARTERVEFIYAERIEKVIVKRIDVLRAQLNALQTLAADIRGAS